MGVCLVGAGLVLLPTAPRKAAISLMVVYHFGGILVATTNQDPSNTRAPWMSNKLWEYAYRPYLGFMYMNNAYHFYSPDPGPPDLVWFTIEYDNGAVRRVHLPERDQSPVPLHYTRLLAMATSLSAPLSPQAIGDQLMEQKRQKRIRAGDIKGIPMHPNALIVQQYQEPNFLGKMYTASYVRHIAHLYPHPDNNPKAEIKAIKAYHVVHDMLSPAQLVQGYSPLYPPLYRPYLLGEFHPDGSFTEEGAQDPFLYWLLPIFLDVKPNGTVELVNGYDIYDGVGK
jgi:hypothetical protein